MKTVLDLVVITLLGSPLITPLLHWASVPCTHDGHLHYHRAAAMRHAWSQGLIFSRWLPDLAFGYGYPFFIYREPLPLYLLTMLHVAGLPLPAASNLLYALSILAAGWFMFLWARDLFGAIPAFVAAVAYMSAPYLLVDAFVRGNLVESTALALLPLLCWSGRRFVIGGRKGAFAIAVLGLAALSLSHNISLLLFTPMLLIYLAFLAWLHRLPTRLILSRVLLIFGLGLGLTLFHTGAALLELDEITITQSVVTRNNDFRYNFASLGEIFAPVAPEDPSLINPPLPFRVGWVPAGLALLGLLSLPWQRDRERRWHLILMGFATLALLFMALPISRPVWEGLPLIDFVQFPWRFVGRAALPIAFLAAAPFFVIRNPLSVNRVPNTDHGSRITGYGLLLTALPITLLLLESFPLLYPTLCQETPYPTILAVHEYEHVTGLVGVDPEGSYFPKSVARRPDGSPLEADYQAGQPPQRFDTAALPAGATLLSSRYQPAQADIELTTPTPFTARYLSFAFPGWQVTVDGQPAPIVPSDPEGLITFPVSAGEHTIEIRWGITPLRLALAAISLISLVIFVAALLYTRSGTSDISPLTLSPSHPLTLSSRHLVTLSLLALTLLAVKLLLVDRSDSFLRRAAPPPVAQSADVIAGPLRLEGYNLSQESVASGQTFDIEMAWRVMQAPTMALQSNVWLAGPDGSIWSEKETYRPRLYEDAPDSRLWQPGQWVWDSREVQVLPGTPPGRYNIVLTVFPLETLQPLTLQNAAEERLGPEAVLGQITVTRPDTPPVFQPQVSLDATINGLTLLGYNQDRTMAAPGDPLLLTLFWEKPANIATLAAAEISLELYRSDGQLIHRWFLLPVRANYPPAEWHPGERLRGQYALRLPASLESGRYYFILDGTRLGDLTISALERRFQPPPFATAVGARFDDKATLVGYSVDAESGSLTMVWRAESEMATSYRVFVHLLDTQGTMIAQSDAEPAGWTRPTTGWLPGEFIVDAHALSLPEIAREDGLRLRVGLYDAESGQRLTVDGGEYVELMVGP